MIKLYIKPLVFCLTILLNIQIGSAQNDRIEKQIWDQVLVHRTDYGVPHIEADNFEAAGYAMGYLQMEDYGENVVFGLIKARGEWTKFNEIKDNRIKSNIKEDAANRLRYLKAVETFPKLHVHTRELLKGYAQGVNRYLELHPQEFPTWIKPDMTAYDVHAKNLGSHNPATVKTFIDAITKNLSAEVGQNQLVLEKSNVWAALSKDAENEHPDAGSNVWALAPERTTSGHAILMRNPHLSWSAGYYEAHLIVKNHFNFYGDFRIGEPLGIVGGFNEYLGWATTNNNPDPDEIYAFEKDTNRAGNYLLDKQSYSLIKQEVQIEYLSKEGLKKETIVFLSTPYGPVIHEDHSKIYIIRSAAEGEFRTNEQFLKMMKAKNLEQWKDAMRMQARYTSNFTYADRDGQIFYVWNGSIPDLKRPSGRDTSAVFVQKSQDIWSELIPWDDLPHLHNPKGGYVRNENDPFHFTNLNEPLHESDFPDYFPKAQLRLRGQLSLLLIGNEDKLSLEDVVVRKHDMRAILADRVKEDLIRVVEKSKPKGEYKAALKQISNWDNTVAADSKGGVLFDIWWNQYVKIVANGIKVEATPESAGYNAPGTKLFTNPWSVEKPDTTPNGLANSKLASEAFIWAVNECNKRFGSWDLKWGDVYRAKIGEQDYPVGGATGDLGAFRVIWYGPHDSDAKKRQITGGDGWVMAVEFGDTPKAYSVLAYGNSIKKDSPYYADQLKMFSQNEMKPVAFTTEDIKKRTLKTYRPGK